MDQNTLDPKKSPPRAQIHSRDLVKHGGRPVAQRPSVPSPQGGVELPPQVLVLQRRGGRQPTQRRGGEADQGHGEGAWRRVEDMQQVGQLWFDRPHVGGGRRGRVCNVQVVCRWCGTVGAYTHIPGGGVGFSMVEGGSLGARTIHKSTGASPPSARTLHGLCT